MSEPVVMSASSLNTMLRCGLQWDFAYVKRIRRPPGLKMALGIAAHAAIEVDLTQKMESGLNLPKEEVVETFRDAFTKEAEDAEETAKETRGSMLDSGVAIVDFWYDEQGVKTVPVAVEVHGQFTINGVPYDWTADLIDHNVWAQERIRDHKFVSRTPEQSDDRYLINMVGYAIGRRRQTGIVEGERVLEHYVRLKTPKYVPIVLETVTDEEIREFAEIVGGAYDAIQAGTFLPNGLQSGACSWCGYRDLCPAYRGRRSF